MIIGLLLVSKTFIHRQRTACLRYQERFVRGIITNKMTSVSSTFLLIWNTGSGSSEVSAKDLLLCVNLADYPKIWIYIRCIGRILYTYDKAYLLLHQPMPIMPFTKRTPPRVMNTKSEESLMENYWNDHSTNYTTTTWCLLSRTKKTDSKKSFKIAAKPRDSKRLKIDDKWLNN